MIAAQRGREVGALLHRPPAPASFITLRGLLLLPGASVGRPPCLTFFVRLFISKQGRSSESPAITAQAQTSREGGRANPWPGRPACQSLTLPEGGFLPPRGWCKVSRDVAPEGLGPGRGAVHSSCLYCPAFSMSGVISFPCVRGPKGCSSSVS